MKDPFWKDWLVVMGTIAFVVLLLAAYAVGVGWWMGWL